MTLKPNHILIPLVTIAVAVIGSFLTTSGMEWYNTELIQPAITPPKIAFPIAWNIIFVLTTISALIIYNNKKTPKNRKRIIADIFILNAALNVLWSLLFFNLRLIEAALIEMTLLEMTIIALIILIWRTSKFSAALLFPYALWVAFATYLTTQITMLN